MKKPRVFTLFLTLAMLLCALPVSAAEADWLVPKVKDAPDFADVKGAWCESYVETVYEAGLMEGRSAALFDADSNLTIAQITVITARFHSLLNGGDGVLPAPAEGEEWYQPAIDYLKAHVEDANGVGPILGTRIVQMETAPIYAVQNAPRWDLVSFLTSVLPEDALPPINSITSLPDSADEDTLRFYNAGILNGSDEYGTFLGNKPLTRGQAAAMLARIIDPNLRLAFTVKSFDLCRDVLGVEADTVLLTVDGAAVTAAQMARPLCSAVWYQYNRMLCDGPSANDLASAKKAAVQTIQQDLASEILLAQKSLTIDPIDPNTLYPYYGIPVDGHLWERTHAAMYECLLTFYEEQYGADSLGVSPHAMNDTPGREALDHDLLQLTDSMKVELSSDFENLDLSAVQSRLQNLSFAYAL